MARSLK